jgi:hypothetical protein
MATPRPGPEIARCGLGAVLLLWAGVTIGVSFLAAPAKFMAPNLSLSVAMEIGQEEFHALNLVETGFALAALGLAAFARRGRLIWLGIGVAAVLVAGQGLWLLPVLDARAEMIIQGETPPAAPWHALYVVAEVLKLLALLITGWLALWPGRARSAGRG